MVLKKLSSETCWPLQDGLDHLDYTEYQSNIGVDDHYYLAPIWGELVYLEGAHSSYDVLRIVYTIGF